MTYKGKTIRLPSYDTPLDELLDKLRDECNHARQWDGEDYDALCLLLGKREIEPSAEHDESSR